MQNTGILGAVLAGGQSSRFGSNKAEALLHGRTLLDLAIDRLAQWCDTVVVVGTTHATARTVMDWPRAGMGPLGGIAGALQLARAESFAAMLTCGVDSLGLPDDLPTLLAAGASFGPAYIRDQPVVGLWPVSALGAVETILTGNGRHSMRALAEATGARSIALSSPTINVNTPADLAKLEGGSRSNNASRT